MKFGNFYGAMYVELEENEIIEKKTVKLGESTISPGQYVSQLGHKRRSSFEMNDGFYLKFEGITDSNILIFSTNVKSFKEDKRRIYYAFFYIDKNTLFIKNELSGRDISIDSVDIFDEVEEKIIEKQLSFI